MLKLLQPRKKFIKAIAVASGKGGVGKTNVTANLAIALRKLGKEVMILDANLGLSNVERLLGVNQKHGMLQLLTGNMSLRDIVSVDSHGIKILSAGSGVEELSALDSWQRIKILDAFDVHQDDIDILLIDTAAGISENLAFFCIAAQEIIIVTTPEPASLSDASALIKVLFTRYQEKDFHVLVNAARTADEAFGAFRTVSRASEEFVSISLDYLGYLPFDESVSAAAGAQHAFIDLYPDRTISRSLMTVAGRLLNPTDKVKGTLQFFIGSLLCRTSSH